MEGRILEGRILEIRRGNGEQMVEPLQGGLSPGRPEVHQGVPARVVEGGEVVSRVKEPVRYGKAWDLVEAGGEVLEEDEGGLLHGRALEPAHFVPEHQDVPVGEDEADEGDPHRQVGIVVLGPEHVG